MGFDKLSEMKPEKQSSTCHVATFHNDFGAISFERRLKKLGDSQERLMPVPRQVSASCGLGVEFFIPFDPKIHNDLYFGLPYLHPRIFFYCK